MITTLRHLLVDSWAGRAAAILIFLAFIGWGVGDVYSNMGTSSSNTIVQVGSRSITPDDLARALSTQLPAAAQQMGLADASHLPDGTKQQIARQVLHNLVIQNEVQLAGERAGMNVPDELIRKEIFAIPAFHNAAGQFDRAMLNDRLTRIGITEKRLIQMIREDIISRGLLQGMGASVQAPTSLMDRLFAFDADQRVLDVLRVPFTAGTVPAAPTDEQLHRYYDNHPQDFRTTEYRHAKMVVMTADSVAKTIEVPDDVLHKLYDFQARTYNVPETRTLQVLTFQDEAKANAAATAWRNTNAWDAIQKASPDAAAVALPHVRQSDIPNPELAKLAFAAPANQISGPTKTEAGWVVFNITDVVAPHQTSFEQAKNDLRDQVQKQEAPQALQARLTQFQDAIAGSTTLEKIPSNLGAIPAAGSLDARGMTQDGVPAPIPGDAGLRQSIIQHIFSQKKDAQPVVVNGPDGSAFAVAVDEVHPGTLRPFTEVRDQVVQAWTADQQRHVADARVTALFTEAKKGTLAKALENQPEAASLRKDVAVSRVHPDQSLPQNVLRAAFGLKVGTTGMYEGPDAFWLVNVTAQKPGDAGDSQSLRHDLDAQYVQSLQADIPMALDAALEKTVPVSHMNMNLFNQVVASTSPAAANGAQ
ncbi:peptidyl-prolyl cis-trans isomerase [Gluconobacter frateurii]|uniref:peptidylprolyl isomerase n=1 Tax=Gluconobacter frateurii TaxID=38308 RepID=UPI001F062556|nr:peptidyl-prolyl cis-trans isomerase [Gluconobacter frateurii]UMM08355.1 peptidyl-prolyl cis-trans isomerase [Gluconobacter frateurii]